MSCLGKPLEKILAIRLLALAEEEELLPPEQFGNWPNCLCEAVVKLIV